MVILGRRELEKSERSGARYPFFPSRLVGIARKAFTPRVNHGGKNTNTMYRYSDTNQRSPKEPRQTQDTNYRTFISPDTLLLRDKSHFLVKTAGKRPAPLFPPSPSPLHHPITTADYHHHGHHHASGRYRAERACAAVHS